MGPLRSLPHRAVEPPSAIRSTDELLHLPDRPRNRVNSTWLQCRPTPQRLGQRPTRRARAVRPSETLPDVIDLLERRATPPLRLEPLRRKVRQQDSKDQHDQRQHNAVPDEDLQGNGLLVVLYRSVGGTQSDL